MTHNADFGPMPGKAVKKSNASKGVIAASWCEGFLPRPDDKIFAVAFTWLARLSASPPSTMHFLICFVDALAKSAIVGNFVRRREKFGDIARRWS